MAFPRTIVDQRDRMVNIFLRDIPESCAFWKELSQQSIGIFIRSSFPRMVGEGEEHFDLCIAFDEFEFCEFHAVVVRHRVTLANRDRPESSNGDLTNDCCFHVGNLVAKEDTALPFHMCEDALSFLFAEHSVAFPVPDSLSLLDDLRSFIYSPLTIFNVSHPLAMIRAMPSSVFPFL